MSRAWLLPEQIADVLPSQARRVEELRRSLIDRAQAYGYELVMPPLVEHLESLLSGTGQELWREPLHWPFSLSADTNDGSCWVSGVTAEPASSFEEILATVSASSRRGPLEVVVQLPAGPRRFRCSRCASRARPTARTPAG